MLERYNLNLKKIIEFLIMSLVVTAGIFVIFKLAIYLLPFVIALTISTLMEPVIRLIMKKFHISRKFSAAIAIFLLVIVFGAIITFFIIRVISEIKTFYFALPHYFSSFYTSMNSFFYKGSEIYHGLPSELAKSMDTIISNLSLSVMKMINSLFQKILNTAVSIPETFLFIVVTILSTYFISSDRDKIYRFFKQQLPRGVLLKLTNIKNNIFTALIGYIKAQLILMGVTFSILSLGFLAIDIKYALLTALFICLVDALPVLGTGSIMLPWAIYDFLKGDVNLGIYLLIIYGMVVLIRQIIEPKVLGSQIGVHPLLTLIAMYGGLQLFGVLGMFIGPILAIVIKNILSGTFRNKKLKDIVIKK